MLHDYKKEITISESQHQYNIFSEGACTPSVHHKYEKQTKQEHLQNNYPMTYKY